MSKGCSEQIRCAHCLLAGQKNGDGVDEDYDDAGRYVGKTGGENEQSTRPGLLGIINQSSIGKEQHLSRKRKNPDLP